MNSAVVLHRQMLLEFTYKSQVRVAGEQKLQVSRNRTAAVKRLVLVVLPSDASPDVNHVIRSIMISAVFTLKRLQQEDR